MLRVEDLGVLGYGGGVEVAKWWDEKRIADLTITEADFWKKWGTYAYLVPGAAATAASAFGWMTRQESWLQPVSHGFMFGFAGFVREFIKTFNTAGHSSSRAVREAQDILKARQAASKQLAQGKEVSRSYQPEFDSVIAF